MAKELQGSEPSKVAEMPEGDITLDQLAGFLTEPDKQEDDAAEAKSHEILEEDSSETDTPSENVDAEAEGETPEADTEEPTESEEEQETDSEEDPARNWKKRVDKLTARAKTAEEERDAQKAEIETLKAKLQEQLDTAEKPVASATAESPLANVWSEEDLDGELAKARQVKRWCIRNPDGAVIKDGSGEVEYTADQVREMQIRAEDLLEEHGPSRREFLGKAKQSESAALQEFPWWKDRASADYQKAQEILKSAPLMKQYPSYKLALGFMIEGMKAHQARKAEKSAAKPAPKAPKQPAKTSAVPAKVTPKTAEAASAIKNFRESMSEKDLASVLEKL